MSDEATIRELLAVVQREVPPSERPATFDAACRQRRLDPTVAPFDFEDQIDALPAGGADQEDADPFAALRALPEWQALVAANDHFDDANVSDLIAYVRHSEAAADLVAAIPGAPSTDPAPEPPTCSHCEGSGREPSPTEMAQIGALSCLACNGTGEAT